MEIARDRVALRRGDPEVGAAGVKNHFEGLWRRAERDLGEVWDGISRCDATNQRSASAKRHTLSIHEIANRDRVSAICDVRSLEDLLHLGLGLEPAHVLLLNGLGVLLDIGMFLSLLEGARVGLA